MLRIEMDEAALNSLQRSALESGGKGVRHAMTIRAIRMALESMADSFNRVQQRAASTRPVLVISD